MVPVMRSGLAQRIETGVERSASALFAAAVGYAAYGFSAASGVEPQLALGAAGAGALAYLPCSRLLSLAGNRKRRFALGGFAVPEFEFEDSPEELLLTDEVAPEELLLTDRVDPDELVLTDNDRVEGPLDLDDILAEIGPDARVVRLFDRKAMPAAAATPAQLQARIAEHLGAERLEDEATPIAPPNLAGPSDASQALSAALAELRRSLR